MLARSVGEREQAATCRGGAVAVGLVAVWWPARRAGATDPAIALRAE